MAIRDDRNENFMDRGWRPTARVATTEVVEPAWDATIRRPRPDHLPDDPTMTPTMEPRR